MKPLSTILVWLAAAGLTACASTPTTSGPDTTRPSIAQTESVDFLGKRFDLKSEDEAGPTRIYEYFAGSQSPDDWLELVEFQVYPVHPEANAPMDFAQRTAAALRQRYPQMRFGLYADKESGAALLDFFFPRSLRQEPGKQFLEFNAFKFFSDENSERTLSFHYARNIEGLSSSRTEADVIEDLKQTRAQVIPAMARFPLYRQ